MHASEHGAADHEPGAHSHPGPGTYVVIGVILAIITGVEVYVYTEETFRAALSFILVGLSAVKFILVVGFFMHLRFDNKLFTAMFGFGLLIAVMVVSALLLLFSYHPAFPHDF